MFNARSSAKQHQCAQSENEVASILAGLGYRVHQNPTQQQIDQARIATGDSGKTGRKPDFLIEGNVFDCYAPDAETSEKGIWRTVAGKVDKRQTQRVVIDLRQWRGDIDELRRQFERRPIRRLKELVAIGQNGRPTQLVPAIAKRGGPRCQ